MTNWAHSSCWATNWDSHPKHDNLKDTQWQMGLQKKPQKQKKTRKIGSYVKGWGGALSLSRTFYEQAPSLWEPYNYAFRLQP